MLERTQRNLPELHLKSTYRHYQSSALHRLHTQDSHTYFRSQYLLVLVSLRYTLELAFA